MSNHIIISKHIDILSYLEKIWKITNKIISKPEKFYEKFLGVNFIFESPTKIIRTIKFIGNIEINEEILINKPELIIKKTGINNCEYNSAELKISIKNLDTTHCIVEIVGDYIIDTKINQIEFYNKANDTITQLLYSIKTFSENLYSN